MEKQMMRLIEEKMCVIKNKEKHSYEEVVSAINIVAQGCVRLFCIKVLKNNYMISKNGRRSFDFWRAVDNEKVEKCFGCDLLQKIKEIVKRCQEIIRIVRESPYNQYYIADILTKIEKVERDAIRKIYEFRELEGPVMTRRHKWKYEEDYLCCDKFLRYRILKNKSISNLNIVEELSLLMPDISIGSISMKISNIEYLAKKYISEKTLGGTLTHFSQQNKEAFIDAMNELGITISNLEECFGN